MVVAGAARLLAVGLFLQVLLVSVTATGSNVGEDHVETVVRLDRLS